MAGLALGHRSASSAAPQASMIEIPTAGRYVYRSACDAAPTCTNPITGTSVPRYQNHPTANHGRRRSQRSATTVMASRTKAAAPTCHAGSSWA